MKILIIVSLIAMLLYISYTDMKRRQIENVAIVIILILSIAMSFWITDIINIIAPLLILVIGFLLSYFGIVGAGDIKLLVALTVALDNEMVVNFLFLMAIAGIPVTIVAFIVHKIKKSRGHCEVPYGVAITLGYCAMLLITEL